MKIIVSGASGLIGKKLVSHLRSKGHELVRLVRSKHPGEGECSWDPESGKIESKALEGADAVIHLSGESVAQRWSDGIKERIVASRLNSTRLLAETMVSLDRPPRVFISASAVGYYGDRGAEEVSEESAPGKGFLAELCKSWEDATALAAKRGIRTVNLRIGVVLSKEGGALAKMLPPFLVGAGGILGSGNQYMSWISMQDLLEAVHFILNNDEIRGPINLVAPNPVTNQEFTRSLGKVLHRPTMFPVPAFGAKLLFGQMAEEMLLSGARVKPSKLEAAGFKYHFPDLEPALSQALRN